MLLVRRGAEIFAIGALCTHYHGPLADGLIVDDTVRCPWHHACFDLRTGEALHAPAFESGRYAGGRAARRQDFRGREARSARARNARAGAGAPNRIAIVGGGGAGFAAAEMLRRRDYQGDIVMLSSDDVPPVDRPNLSKDYLAGSAPEEWVPLRPTSFYADNAIDLRLGATVAGIDVRSRTRWRSPTATRFPSIGFCWRPAPSRCARRFPAQSRPTCSCCARFAIAGRSSNGRKRRGGRSCSARASSGSKSRRRLRARNIEVHVVAPEERPMERVLGPEIGDVHSRAARGARRRLPSAETANAVEGGKVRLSGGSVIEADLIVAGLGVRPRVELAESGRPQGGSGRRRRRSSRNERAGNLRRRRHRALAGSHRPARPFASNTGSWPSGRGRSRR